MKTTAYAITIVILCIVVCGQALCQTRTTPVEVTNSPTVKVDSTANTVKSQQSGTWNVGVTGTPNVNVVNNLGVNVLNAPNVNVTNTPAVSISPSGNTVTPVTKTNQVQLWLTNQSVDNNSTITSAWLNCAGYREIRVVIGASTSSENLKVRVWFGTALGGTTNLLTGNFSAASHPICDNANFQASSAQCVFVIPVMSDLCVFTVWNTTGAPVTVYNWSWAYLLN